MDFQKVDGEAGELISLTAGAADNTWVLKHSEDYLVKEYLIEEWYDPYYNGQKLNPEDFYWTYDFRGMWGSKGYYLIKHPAIQRDIWVNSSEDGLNYEAMSKQNFLGPVTRVRNSSKDGTKISKEKFESTGWWYCPGHGELEDGWGPWAACQTRNNPAELINSIDTRLVSNDLAGFLVVEVLHNNKTDITRIPVYTETRSCAFDYIE